MSELGVEFHMWNIWSWSLRFPSGAQCGRDHIFHNQINSDSPLGSTSLCWNKTDSEMSYIGICPTPPFCHGWASTKLFGARTMTTLSLNQIDWNLYNILFVINWNDSKCHSYRKTVNICQGCRQIFSQRFNFSLNYDVSFHSRMI